MRMSAFLLGGFLGAVVAMYVSRNKAAVLAGINWDKAVDKIGDMLRMIRSMPITVTAVQNDGVGGHKTENGNANVMKNGLSGETDREVIESLFSEDP